MENVRPGASPLRSLLVVAATALVVGGLSACPEEKDELTEKVGGAAKAQVDKAEARVNAAAEKAAERLEEATAEEGAEDEGGW